MVMKHGEDYRDPQITRNLAQRIRECSTKPVRLMEVCGTHTVSIFRSGIRSLLPEHITLVSGPGCPVCVTDQSAIDALITLSQQPDVILATFGDLIRVPGTASSLQQERALGRDIRVVYSALDALEIAAAHKSKRVIFPGIGFETTAPTLAATIHTARQKDLQNFWVLSALKLVPPALEALLQMPGVQIDGFILPGHVSVIIGSQAYLAVTGKYQVPAVVTGFEPGDILLGILKLVEQIESGAARLENAYARAVTAEGNQKAQAWMETVFETATTSWRGIGPIPQSGLKIRPAYQAFDAQAHFSLPSVTAGPPPGCRCGDILTGRLIPLECPLYQKACTPLNPVGPCMVSSEGTCAAYNRYYMHHPLKGVLDENG